MTAVIIHTLLATMVIAVWLGAFGFARLRSPFDRVHCAAFINATAGIALTAATFVADGASIRAFKMLLITAVSLLTGAAMSHATGRALLLRAQASDPDTHSKAKA